MALTFEVREIITNLSGERGEQAKLDAAIDLAIRINRFNDQEKTIELMAAKIRRLEGGYDPHSGDKIEFVPDEEFLQPDNYLETTITSFGQTRKGTPIRRFGK